MTEVFNGIKTIQIHAQTRYPIVSAYEFEFLKSETEIQALLKPCTIYFILQRPLLYFDNVKIENGEITFRICDSSSSEPLHCTFEPSECGLGAPDEEILLDVQFYKKTPDTVPPFNDVGALRFLNLKRDFLGWFSPTKFLYEYLLGTLAATIDGDITKYLNYKVHYIGKSFSQDIWNRLTGHEKMQSILTLEDVISAHPNARAPFEICLLMLDIDGFDEANLFPSFEFMLQPGDVPIVHNFTMEDDDDQSFIKYYSPALEPRAAELTTEVEAMLVSSFKPKYNKIVFEKYPFIQSGTRSAGYTKSSLLIERMPAILSTDDHEQGLVLPRHSNDG